MSTNDLGERLQRERIRRFVGRAAELEILAGHLVAQGTEKAPAVLWVYGPGGIGKSSLLAAYAHQAGVAGRSVAGIAEGSSPASTRRALIDALGATATGPTRADQPVVLLDAVERWAVGDDWLRDELLPALPEQSLVVVAHRRPPGPRWLADPGWRQLLRMLPLGNLDHDAVRILLAAEGLPARLLPAVMRLSFGHPLAAALCLEGMRRSDADQVPDSFGEAPALVDALLSALVDRPLDGARRIALQVCAHAAVTTESVLRAAMPDVPPAEVSRLWDGLRELSVVEEMPTGLRLLPLARSVVDTDLRRRDPEGYALLHQRLRTHSIEQLRRSAGHPAAVRQAAGDLLFLARPLLGDSARGDEPGPGPARVIPVRAGDIPDLIDFLRRIGGRSAARAGGWWLERQPESFRVVRDDSGGLVGVGARLPLHLVRPEALAADPGAAGLLRHAEQHAPARAGELVLAWRFLVDGRIDADRRRGVEACFRAWHLEDILLRPTTAWEFVDIGAGSSSWSALLRGWDFTHIVSDDRRQTTEVTYAHDWRRVGVALWLERSAARELGEDIDDEPAAETATLPYEDFAGSVKQALRDLHRPSELLRNPLLGSGIARARRRAEPESSPDRVLRGLVSDAAEVLKADPRNQHLYRVLDRTYLRPAPSQEKAAEQLDLPFTTFRRYRDRAVASVSDWLWELDVDSGVRSA
ncbi:MAG: ATP-binding protein [Microlunatus sp.]